MSSWPVALVGATSVHAAFQLTVTTRVYPALVRVPSADFAGAHARHSTRIVPIVALVYAACGVASVGAVAADPGAPLAWVSAVGTGVAVGVTALRGAPLHARLGRRGPEPGLLRSLVRADRVRTAAAVVAVVAAVAYARTH